MTAALQYGTIVDVTTTNLGEPLVADAAIAATTLFVGDAATFNELGGFVDVNGNIYAYNAIDTTLNTITLVGGLSAAAVADDRVEIVPAAPVTRALVDLNVEEAEAVLVTVPHALVPTLADGMREDANRESVLLEERTAGQLYLQDVIAAESAEPVSDDTGWITTLSQIAVASASNTLTAGAVRRIGKTVHFSLEFTWGAALGVTDLTGNVADTAVAQMVAVYRPGGSSPIQGGLSNALDGLHTLICQIDSTGLITAITSAGTQDFSAGETASVGG